jgi:hypothetical protein
MPSKAAQGLVDRCDGMACKGSGQAACFAHCGRQPVRLHSHTCAYRTFALISHQGSFPRLRLCRASHATGTSLASLTIPDQDLSRPPLSHCLGQYFRPVIVRGEQCAGARPHAGGAGQLSRGGGGQGRGAGAVTAEQSWVAERPRRRNPGEVGPPSGCRRSRGCPDAGQAGRCPVRLVRSAVGMSVQPVERTSSIHASGVQCIQVTGRTRSGVRGAAAALSARWTRSGSVWRAAPAGRSGSTCRPGPRAAWSPACIGPDGKGMVRHWPCLARMRSTVARAAAGPASRQQRRLGPQRPTRALV